MSNQYQISSVNRSDYQAVERSLGRPPRGLISVPVRSKLGEPTVIQVASLVDKKPFPTLFWLVDSTLNYAIDQLEASGFIASMQEDINTSSELRQAMIKDHRDHIALRRTLMPQALSAQVDALGFASVFEHRGIGGIENFSRIRCLHTYYAAHLVIPNTIGTLLDKHWQAEEIIFDHLWPPP